MGQRLNLHLRALPFDHSLTPDTAVFTPFLTAFDIHVTVVVMDRHPHGSVVNPWKLEVSTKGSFLTANWYDTTVHIGSRLDQY